MAANVEAMLSRKRDERNLHGFRGDAVLPYWWLVCNALQMVLGVNTTLLGHTVLVREEAK